VVTTLCTCASLGLRAAYVGTFGEDDDAAYARQELRRRGVDTAGAITRPCTTRQAMILVEPDGERLVLWSRDPALAIEPSHLPAGLVASARLVHVDAVDVAAAHEAARVARAAGALVTCDVDTVDDATAALVDAVTHPILAEHVPATLTGEADAERAIRVLGRRHPGPICVTLGAQGALLLEHDRVHRVAGWPVDAVDTTGAGDVFAGVLAAEWLAGHEDALRRACAAGALSTLVPGAGDCAPYAEAIDDAVVNRRAGERQA